MFSVPSPYDNHDINRGPINPDGKFSWFDHSKFGGKIYQPAEPSKRTTDPTVTGTSVLGVKYNGGVAIAADTLASYGSMARFRDVKRIVKAGKFSLLSAGGEFSDFQHLTRMVDDLVLESEIADQPQPLTASEIYNYLTRVMYQRRNKMDPLWNSVVIAGFDARSGQPFLGSVDLLGTHFQDDHVATGYGDYLARPILRNAWRPDLTEEEAVQLLKTCMRVLYYRDARSSARIQIATVTKEKGAVVHDPIELDTDWTVGTWTFGYDGRKQKSPVASATHLQP